MASCLKQMPFSWYGGKAEWADWYVKRFPKAQTLTLPYGGAGSPLWNVETPYPVEVYNDLDSGLVNFFRVCREQPEALANALELTPYSREEYELCKAVDAADAVERARQFAYVARASHGGAFGRSWSHAIGHSRRGMSSSVSRLLHLPETVREIAVRLKTVQVEHRRARDCIKHYDTTETFHFIDPPYVPKTRNGSKVYKHEMAYEQHEKLLKTLLKCEGRIMLCGYANELYDTKLKNWYREELLVACRSSNESKTTSQKRTEVIWCNYDVKALLGPVKGFFE